MGIHHSRDSSWTLGLRNFYFDYQVGNNMNEELNIKDVLKGNYPKDVSREFMEKQRDQLKLEITSSLNSKGIVLYLDPEMTKIADDIYFGVCEEGEHKDLRVYLKNNTEAVLLEFKISFDDPEVEVVKTPSRVFPHQGGEFILRYSPKGEKRRPLNATMNFSCNEVYLAKGHEDEIL